MLTVHQVRGAVATLKPEYRAVLFCVYYRQLTTAEAAEELGIPVGTVKSRTYHALRALMPALRMQGIDPEPRPGTRTAQAHTARTTQARITQARTTRAAQARTVPAQVA